MLILLVIKENKVFNCKKNKMFIAINNNNLVTNILQAFFKIKVYNLILNVFRV